MTAPRPELRPVWDGPTEATAAGVDLPACTYCRRRVPHDLAEHIALVGDAIDLPVAAVAVEPSPRRTRPASPPAVEGGRPHEVLARCPQACLARTYQRSAYGQPSHPPRAPHASAHSRPMGAGFWRFHRAVDVWRLVDHPCRLRGRCASLRRRDWPTRLGRAAGLDVRACHYLRAGGADCLRPGRSCGGHVHDASSPTLARGLRQPQRPSTAPLVSV